MEQTAGRVVPAWIDFNADQKKATIVELPKREDIEKVIGEFIGQIDQSPPNYSAKCVNGKRGYQLARQGVDFTLEPKKVNVLNFQCLGQTDEDEYEFQIDCKGGTYIRSLARDLALKVGSLGVMSSLDRVKCGIFSYENSVTVEDFKKSLDGKEYLIKSEQAVNFEKLILTENQAMRALNGLKDAYDVKDGLYRVYNQTEFWGVASVTNGILKINSYVR